MATQAHHRAAPTERLKGNEWRALRILLPYLLEYKWRVAAALACLIAAKLANVAVPLIMKEVVDGLDPRTAIVAVPVALLAIYGSLRFSTTLFAELRDVVFVRVTQRAIRRVALGVFRHLHSLSLRFHLERQTGGMTRDIERGTRGISTLLSYLLFSIIPVILEFALVAAVLIGKFDWRFAAVTFGAVAVYIGFTVTVTEWRMEIRRRANELDSRGMVYREIKQSLLDMDRMFRLLGEHREVEDRPGALEVSPGSATVEFRAVDFSYEPNRQILFDVSLTIPAGKRVAVVGHSGSGKSTLARLLYRFYDVSGGALFINGKNLLELKQASVRAAIGIVPQDTVLFND